MPDAAFLQNKNEYFTGNIAITDWYDNPVALHKYIDNSAIAQNKESVKVNSYGDCSSGYTNYYWCDDGWVTLGDCSYLFSVCNDSYASIGQPDIGGDAEEDAFYSSKPMDWTVSKYPSYWELKSIEKFDGVKKQSEPQGGHFTGFSHDRVYFYWGDNNFTWQEISVTPSLDNSRLAHIYIYGKIKMKGSTYEEPVNDAEKKWSFNEVF